MCKFQRNRREKVVFAIFFIRGTPWSFSRKKHRPSGFGLNYIPFESSDLPHFRTDFLLKIRQVLVKLWGFKKRTFKTFSEKYRPSGFGPNYIPFQSSHLPQPRPGFLLKIRQVLVKLWGSKHGPSSTRSEVALQTPAIEQEETGTPYLKFQFTASLKFLSNSVVDL